MNIHDRISALETELADLKKAANKTTPPPPPPKEDRPLIVHPQPLSIELPTLDQSRKLIDIIATRHPQLKPRYSMKWADVEDRELLDGFVTSIRCIGTLGRADKPDHRYAVSYWSTGAENFAADNQISPAGNIGRGFFLAAVALRVVYVLPDPAQGIVAALGLRQHGGGGALIIADDWRKTLSGDVLAPTPAEKRFAPPSPAIVR